MRAVVQRCVAGRVEVGGETVGQTHGPGLVAFVGAGKGDADADARYLADRIVGVRVFADERGRMGRSLLDVGGGLLVVSQFTLYADLRRGRRPGFDGALEPVAAERLVDLVVAEARRLGARVETGRFGADMRVSVENDGPVTLLFESRPGG